MIGGAPDCEVWPPLVTVDAGEAACIRCALGREPCPMRLTLPGEGKAGSWPPPRTAIDGGKWIVWLVLKVAELGVWWVTGG